MRILLCLFVLSMCMCTDKEDCVTGYHLPECIDEIIDDDDVSPALKTVQVQTVGGELHYWLNTDARHYDGAEFIVNSSCDTVCSFCGECYPPACVDDYDGDWEVIWRK